MGLAARYVGANAPICCHYEMVGAIAIEPVTLPCEGNQKSQHSVKKLRRFCISLQFLRDYPQSEVGNIIDNQSVLVVTGIGSSERFLENGHSTV